MDISIFLAIVSFGIACFSIGYVIGKDSEQRKK